MTTHQEAMKRKQIPVYNGFIKYFPLAILEVARLSYVANQQHNPGTDVHWDRSKSGDELDAMCRHLVDNALDIEVDSDEMYHLTKVAWRAMAKLQKFLEEKRAVQSAEKVV